MYRFPAIASTSAAADAAATTGADDDDIVDVKIPCYDRFVGTLTKQHLAKYSNVVTGMKVTDQKLKKLELGIFANFINLKSIDLSVNFIEELDKKVFVSNKKLVKVNLMKNRLTHIDPKVFSKLENLEILNLSNNIIKKIELNFCDSRRLKELDLSFNKLTEIHKSSLKCLDSLTILKLHDNEINKFELEAPELQVLYLSNNLLIAFECFFPKLGILMLPNNNLADMIHPYYGRNLVTLDLLNNSIKKLSSADQFKDSPNLEILQLKIDLKFQFRSIENLVHLKLFKLDYAGPIFPWNREPGSERRLVDFFGKMLNFQYLTLIFKNFTVSYLDRLNSLKSLSKLWVECKQPNMFEDCIINLHLLLNGMEKLDFVVLKNLNKFKIDKYIPLDENENNIFKKLTHLCLIGFKNFEFGDQLKGFPSLTHLILSHNNIEKISENAFVTLPNLTNLNMEHSRLEEIKLDQFRYKGRLEYLNFSHCQIKHIEDFSFAHLYNLKILNVMGNPLEDVTIDTFGGLDPRRCKIFK